MTAAERGALADLLSLRDRLRKRIVRFRAMGLREDDLEDLKDRVQLLRAAINEATQDYLLVPTPFASFALGRPSRRGEMPRFIYPEA